MLRNETITVLLEIFED